MAAAFYLLPPDIAEAQGYNNCPESHHYNATARQDDSRRRGVRVNDPGMWIASDDSVTCNRVSSIFVFKDGLNQVEFGWAYQGPGLVNQCGQTSEGSSLPWRLTSVLVAGEFYCPEGRPGVHLNVGFDRAFSILNSNADGHYDFSYNGNYIVTNAVDAGFSSGWVVVNGERTTCVGCGDADIA